MESDLMTEETPIDSQGRWLRIVIGLCAVLAVALLAAGYFISTQLGDNNKTVKLVGATTSATPTGSSKAAVLVDCMRKNGVPNYPAPGPDGQLRILKMDGVDMNSQAFKGAQKACQAFMPKGPAPQPAGAAPPQIDVTAYVTCMRKNGLPDLPGPVNGTFNYDTSTAKFKAAQAICKKFLPKDAPPPPG